MEVGAGEEAYACMGDCGGGDVEEAGGGIVRYLGGECVIGDGC